MKLFNVALLGGLLTLLRMLAGFIISKCVAIYAGPAGMAQLGQLQNFVAGLNGLIANQIGQGVVRYTADNKEQGIEACQPWWVASTSLLILNLVFSLLITVLFSHEIANWLFGNELFYWVIIVTGLALPLNAISTILMSVLNGLGDNGKNIACGMIGVICTTFFSIACLYLYGLSGGLFAVAVNNGISAVVVLLKVYKEPWFKLRHWFAKADSSKRKAMVGYMLMGIIGALTGPTAMIIVRNLITENASIDAAGLWQAVIRVSDAYVSILTIGVGMYYFPKVASIHSSLELNKETKNVLYFLMPLMIVAAVSIYISRELIIKLLFTKDFSGAGELFLTRLIGDVLRVAAFVPATILLAKGYFKLNAIAEISWNLIFVVIAFLTVPKLGAVGANYAYIICYIIYLLFMIKFYFFHSKKMNVLDGAYHG
ncbi:MAG: O-antigen translocase [Proteobacteria bacterium]|nr:O-antigen translocase [Pseudomonadota bacterium]